MAVKLFDDFIDHKKTERFNHLESRRDSDLSGSEVEPLPRPMQNSDSVKNSTDIIPFLRASNKSKLTGV